MQRQQCDLCTWIISTAVCGFTQIIQVLADDRFLVWITSFRKNHRRNGTACLRKLTGSITLINGAQCITYLKGGDSIHPKHVGVQSGDSRHRLLKYMTNQQLICRCWYCGRKPTQTQEKRQIRPSEGRSHA